MPKYRVYYVQTASTSVDVKADSQDEAEEMGFEELPASLCHECAGTRDVGDWDVSTNDETGESATELIEQ